MRIAWISSWPPRHCGIATYSQELVHALREKGSEVHIVCHTDGGSPGEQQVHPVIDTKKAGWDQTLYETVKEIDPDVVHIQHEFGLYRTQGDHSSILFRPLFRWKVEGKFPVVVTFHSVYTQLNRMIRIYMDLILRQIDAGVVHAEYQWVYLPVNLGQLAENVYVIPHGAKGSVKVSKEEAKDRYGLSGKRVVGMIGWFAQTKAFHRVIDLWDELAGRLKENTILMLAGDARMGDPGQVEYKKDLLARVEKCTARDRIKLVLGSFSPLEYDTVLSCFDVMVLPYTFASQSGNLAHSFALGIPAIVSGLEGLKAEVEASRAGIAVPPGDDTELKRAIMMMMEDERLRKQYAQKARQYVKKRIAWPLIAEKHMKLYKKVIHKLTKGETDRRREALL